VSPIRKTLTNWLGSLIRLTMSQKTTTPTRPRPIAETSGGRRQPRNRPNGVGVWLRAGASIVRGL
jgi:hypothetical protein